MMKRINVLTGRELFNLQSLDVATRLKESISNDNSQCISKAERAKLFEDLRLLYFALKDAMDPSISGGDVDDLRRLLTPPYRLFDHNGDLQPRLVKGLIDAGAKAVMVAEDQGSVVIVVEGPDPETDFLRNFRNMSLPESPTIKYTQCEWSPEGGGEEALTGFQMGSSIAFHDVCLRSPSPESLTLAVAQLGR
eukprot:gene16879-12081_t